MKRVVQNPATTIVQQQIKSKEVKVLVNLESNDQRLITSSLPEEDFSVQDLLENINLELIFGLKRFIVSWVNDEISGINYIIDPSSGDVNEQINDSKSGWKDSSRNYGKSSEIKFDENSNHTISQNETRTKKTENTKEDSKLLHPRNRRKRLDPKKNSKGLGSICISSDEEPEKKSAKLDQSVFPTNKEVQKCREEKPRLKIPSSSINSLRADLSCSTIRIGSYKCKSDEFVTVSKHGLQLVVPSLKDNNKFVTLDIKYRHIIRVQSHFGQWKAIIFFNTSSKSVARIRETLGMDDPKGPYFDPKSREYAHRKITLVVRVINLEYKLILNKLFRTDLEILTLKEANEILIRISRLDDSKYNKLEKREEITEGSKSRQQKEASSSELSLQKSANFSTSPEKVIQKSGSSKADLDSDLSENHSLSMTVIKNPETTIVQQQVKGNLVKMLVILLNRTEKLITFDIPAENCTVQDLMDQIIYHFGSDKVVSLVNDPTLGINYILQFKSEDLNEQIEELKYVEGTKENGITETLKKETPLRLLNESKDLIYISSDEDWEDETKLVQVELSCRTVRIGSYKFKPDENVVVSEDGLRLVVPSLEDNKKLVTLNIKSDEIVRVLSHFGKWTSIFFVHTSKETGAMIREALGMKDPRGPYYDPASKDLKQRRITLLSKVVTLESQEILTNKLFKNKVEELNQKEANEILLRLFSKLKGSQYEDPSYICKEYNMQNED